MIEFFDIPGSTGYSCRNEADYSVTFADVNLNRAVTVEELNVAKLTKLKVEIDYLTASKIALIFNLPAKGNDLLIKQLNATARTTELQDIKLSGGVLTTAEQVEMDSIKAIWVRVKALRAYGNFLESEVDVDINIDINNGWPE